MQLGQDDKIRREFKTKRESDELKILFVLLTLLEFNNYFLPQKKDIWLYPILKILAT